MLFDGASYENVTGPVVLRRHHRYAHTCQRGPVADRRIKYSSRRRQVPSLNRQPLFVQTGCKSRAEMGGRGGSNADRSRAALPWCWFDLAIGTATPSPVFIAITFMKRSRRSPPATQAEPPFGCAGGQPDQHATSGAGDTRPTVGQHRRAESVPRARLPAGYPRLCRHKQVSFREISQGNDPRGGGRDERTA